jgi:hypothetical protein
MMRLYAWEPGTTGGYERFAWGSAILARTSPARRVSGETSMRVRHYPTDSKWARYWRDTDLFEIYSDAHEHLMTSTGAELLVLVAVQTNSTKQVADIHNNCIRSPDLCSGNDGRLSRADG